MFYLFATAIVIGAAMAFLRLRGKPRPSTGLVLLHGIFAASGLIAIIVVAIDNTNRTSHVTGPMILFCIAAILGFLMLFGYHMRQKALPIGLMIAHAILAVVAFVWLLA